MIDYIGVNFDEVAEKLAVLLGIAVEDAKIKLKESLVKLFEKGNEQDE